MKSVLSPIPTETSPASAAGGQRRYYSVSQAAQILGVSRVTIWRWIRSGQLRAVHLGHRTVRISELDLERAQRQFCLVAGQSPSPTKYENVAITQQNGTHPSSPPVEPHRSDTAQHVVQFYDADASLVDAVHHYLRTGLLAGDAAIIIATPDHRVALEQRLEQSGLDIAQASASGRYFALDADATLAQFMLDGMPDSDRFLDVIGQCIERATEGSRNLRAFGEMVALLALEGNHAAAVRLEELWNDLQRRLTFTLYCAYPLERLASAGFAGALEDVCAAHGSVIPTESYTALLTPDERMRAIILLQEKARRLETEIAEREAAEQALREESEITETLARIGSSLTSTLDAEALVQAVTDAATKVSGAAFGAFFHNVTDERGESYRLYTISGAPKQTLAEFPDSCNTALFEPTVCNTGPIRIDDVTVDSRYGKNPPYYGMPPGHLPVRSYLGVPVRSRSGEMLGGLFFGHPEAGMFSQRSERLVTGIATWASIALDNARLYRDAVTAVHVRDEFLSSVSHDLKTPLTTIRGMTQVSRRRLQRLATEPTEQIAGSLNHVEQAAGKMTAMIDELLDLTRLESGRPLDLNCKPMDLLALIEQLADAHQRGAPEHPIRVQAGSECLTGEWDTIRLERVISNLLSNAIKYSPDGGSVTMTVRREDAADGSAWARLCVEDEGIGIPAGELASIFERFRRGSNVPRGVSGAGIGLAGAKQIVEQHHGTIAVESQEGKGTRFTVRLPLGTAEAKLARQP
jgi:excisionase family DNA binding protein